ncbi:hypothetical protein AVEN_205491-1 [Araneus ventricosus]|uniref:Uncharacterized protein n=1 Tax=Araneus ventricosus TaxID=182803 RepID=A0A4Y2JDB7_ARAVE|nr:hypothetical protein AVEN_205491-1 [Araneus ventricosus]
MIKTNVFRNCKENKIKNIFTNNSSARYWLKGFLAGLSGGRECSVAEVANYENVGPDYGNGTKALDSTEKSIEGWFCLVRETECVLDMLMCSVCVCDQYIHESCMGLTKQGKTLFI